MIASLNSWVRELIALLVLAGLVDFFVPAGQMRRYVKLVLGTFLLLAILNPLFRFLGNPPELSDLLPTEMKASDLAAVTAQAEQFRRQNEGLVAQELRRSLAVEAERLAQEQQGVAVAQAEVSLTEVDGQWAIAAVQLTIWTSEEGRPVARVEPVEVGGEPRSVPDPGSGPVLQKVRQRVAGGLGLSEGQVEVRLRSQ